jgi:hypothetical protein
MRTPTPSFRPRRRGSALVIVLGVLSVLMLMAVAFSTFVRTERGGSTNLKNSFVARSSLDTALGRAMEAIDLAFGAADNDDPVAPWPYPWLASAEGGDHYQCGALGATETAGAHVLTAEIAEDLTPAQLALAKSAKCNWAPIYSSINASQASPGRTGHDWGGYGRPVEDSLVGRYAFIALETTGLLDMNNDGGGTAAERKATTGGDPLALILPNRDAKDSDGDTVPRFVKSATSFVSKRDSSKMFYSMADAKNRCGTAVLAIKATDIPTVAGDYYPADLFAGFAPSLSELDPEGNPKIQLPRRSELGSWASKDWTALVRRTFRAMVAIFARGRVANGRGATSYGEDQFTIFQNCGPTYQLSRAALATVALLDGVDADFIPGQSTSPTCNYWSYLPTVSAQITDNNGNKVSVSESKPSFAGSANPLNYPCTESAPLLNSVFAYIEIGDHHDSTSGDKENWVRTYDGTLHVGARAICQNKTTKSSSHKGTVRLDWEVMEGQPSDNTVTGGTDKGIRDELIEWTGGSGGGGFHGGGGGDGTEKIAWKDFFTSGSVSSSSKTVNDASSSAGSRQIVVEDEVNFTIECAWSEDLDDFYPPTRAQYLVEEEGDNIKDVFIPIRMKVTITGDGGAIQQVPAPAIASTKDFWIRVDPAVYHSGSSQYGGNSDGSLGDLAWGWAFCAVPMFAFDTSSLVTVDDKAAGSTMGFWINNIIAMKDGGGGGFHGGGIGGGRFDDMLEDFFFDGSANDNARQECAAAGFKDPIWNYAQTAWLFKTDDDYANVLDWMNTSSGAHMPDMMHSAKKGGKPFVESNGSISSGRIASELYSRIPADGYGNAADLGTVLCGPYETLSLFKTWRYGSGRADFHPVVDYFTTDRDRYPDRKEITAAGATADGDVDWTELSGDGTSSDPYKDLYSAVHNGRVNLNAPPLVAASKIANNVSVRGEATEFLNPYPIAAVFNGAPYPSTASGSTVTNAIDEQTALTLATDFCRMLEESQLPEAQAKSTVFNNHPRNVVRNLSFLGSGNDHGSYADHNKLLEDFITLGQPRDDNERESLIRGTIDGFTTRGQTYLVIIRADAYSPKFGENDSVQDGTTLATTHALVELFRDPAPARAPDGSYPSDGSHPVSYHNWQIRSFRVF